MKNPLYPTFLDRVYLAFHNLVWNIRVFIHRVFGR